MSVAVSRWMAHGTVTNKLIESHLMKGRPQKGEAIALEADQALLQDATGTLVMLELLSLGIDRIEIDLAAQYVDHNLIQADSKNPDDHVFLLSACKRFGIHFSPPGNGVSHPVHMAKFGKPGAFLVGSDSHTCAGGSMGMLAIGTGGLNVAMAMVGENFNLTMPEIVGVELVGSLKPWVSAKDVILELLRRRGVSGGRGKIFEYFGEGLAHLTAMDRHVIANMGAELGATTSVFPADTAVQSFLFQQRRGNQWREILSDDDAEYDSLEKIDLAKIEPLIAKPSSPGNVVTVKEVEGEPIYQTYVGSSANPGFRDFAMVAEIVAGKKVFDGVSFDVNPTSREILLNLVQSGHMMKLVQAGARIHQTGCNGCIGMGQAPATGRNSLRTTPRNFPGRSGSPDDHVWLCSPETAAASALTGKITDPRALEMDYPKIVEPTPWLLLDRVFVEPLPAAKARKVEIVMGPNIKNLLEIPEAPGSLKVAVALKLGDDISTDEILPAGARALPYRSNIEKISEFAFRDIDPDYPKKAKELKTGNAIVAGKNYGQGSSREHAALALVFLGLKTVVAKSYSRIHFQNLINFGVTPFVFQNADDFEAVENGATLEIENLHQAIETGSAVARVENSSRHEPLNLNLAVNLTAAQREILLAGGMINWKKKRPKTATSPHRHSS